MRKYKTFTTVILFVLISFVFHGVVLAVPPLPSSFYGEVTLNNANIAEGTVIEALVNSSVVGESQTLIYQGQSVYTIDVNGDDLSTGQVEGGKEGDVVKFRIGGLLANESAVWHSGVNFELNLTIDTLETPQPPEPTKTPLPTQTPIINPTQAPTNTPVNEPTTRPTQAVTQNPVTQATATIQSGQTNTETAIPDANITLEMPTSVAVNEVKGQTPGVEAEQISIPSSSSSTTKKENQIETMLEKDDKKDSFSLELIFVLAFGILLVVGYLAIRKMRHQK